MGQEQEGTPKGLIQNFMETTSMHGVNRTVGKPGFIRRCFWVLAVLGGAGVASYNIWKIAVAYTKWEVATVVSLEYNTRLAFPSVSICNLNPVRLSDLVSNSNLKAVRKVIGYVEDGLELQQATGLGLGDLPDLGTLTPKTDYYTSYDEDYLALVDFQEELSNLTRKVRLDIGHSLQDMLLECTFQGKPCTPRNFTRFYNYIHGNCYKFLTDDTEDISRTGPQHGLSLTLYAEENEYISSLSDSIGFKVVVHSSSTMPFPEDEGFNISPGFQTYVGVTKIVVDRASAPYGNCVKYNSETLPANIFLSELEGLGYSDKACEKSCLQKLLINVCECCDSRYPCEQESRGFITDNPPETMKLCDFQEDACAIEIMKDYENDATDCRESCLPNCREESHQLEISSSRWPSTGKVDKIANEILNVVQIKEGSIVINQGSSKGEKTDFIRQNTLKLDVFYKQLNYERIETKPAYDWGRLLSDVGGQAGLWLGFSLLTLGEIVELLLDIFINFFTKCCKSKSKQVNPIH